MENKRLIIGVQFEHLGKIYHYDSSAYPEVALGDKVIVNTSRGFQFADVVKVDIAVNGTSKEEIKAIERPVTPKDLMIRQMMADKESAALKIAQDHVRNANYGAIKVVAAEYSYDGTHLSIMINSEADPKFNVKQFHQELSRKLPDGRLEIRQVGPRDVAKVLSGLGACGLEERCCARFLSEFSSISIRMAKSQDISLTPSEITGMCGRLRCCLDYEYELYEDARKNMPKIKKMVQTPLGEGKVIQVLPLSQQVVVYLPELGRRQFTMQELESGKMAEPESIHTRHVEEEQSLSHDVELVSTEKAVTVKEQRGAVEKRPRNSSRRGYRGNRSRRNRK